MNNICPHARPTTFARYFSLRITSILDSRIAIIYILPTDELLLPGQYLPSTHLQTLLEATFELDPF